VPNPHLVRYRDVRVLQRLGESHFGSGNVVGVDQLEGVTPHPLLGFVAQNPLDRRAHVAEGAASVVYDCREIEAEFAQLKAVEGFPEYGFVDGLEP
jgi:hypothetical protein